MIENYFNFINVGNWDGREADVINILNRLTTGMEEFEKLELLRRAQEGSIDEIERLFVEDDAALEEFRELVEELYVENESPLGDGTSYALLIAKNPLSLEEDEKMEKVVQKIELPEKGPIVLAKGELWPFPGKERYDHGLSEMQDQMIKYYKKFSAKK